MDTQGIVVTGKAEAMEIAVQKQYAAEKVAGIEESVLSFRAQQRRCT